jgi:two-component system sensor histidine kinase KdpD
MNDDVENLFYLGAGPLGAILLGLVLVPLREVTTASNLTFAFLALTIVVAELGGRWPSVATALTSALSLDFFLTKPYGRLVIAEKNDLIAFAGLALCGLLVAALGSRRRERSGAVRIARGRLELFRSMARLLEPRGPLDSLLPKLLDQACDVFPLKAAAVRNSAGDVLATSARGHAAAPGVVLDPQAATAKLPIPTEGARLPLVASGRQVGWLDLWGNGRPASSETRRELADLAALTAVALSVSDRHAPAR